MSDATEHDLIILGAGPAGAAAAALAAAAGLDVVVLDRAPTPAILQVELLNPAAYEILPRLKGARDDFALANVDSITFLNPRQSLITQARAECPVDLVSTHEVSNRIRSFAEEDGAVIHKYVDVIAIEAKEHAVSLIDADGRRRTGKVLIAADGAAAWSAQQLALIAKPPTRPRAVSRQWTDPLWPSPATTGEIQNAETFLMFPSGDVRNFGYVFKAGERIAFGLHADESIDIDDMFDRTIEGFKACGALPSDLKIDRANVAQRIIPRGAALDLDTHVAKRSILVGDAGGFCSALSGEGLYPALLSARLAVEVAAEALDSKQPQDKLTEYNSRWRQDLVEYLRLPNVDLRFLMPLVFSNERMAGKFAAAFLTGQNI